VTNKIVRGDGVTVITGASLLSTEFTEQINTSDDLTFGSVSSSCLTCEVRGAYADSVAVGEELKYYHVDGNTDTLIGTFYAEKPTISGKNAYKFTAYDAVNKLDKDLTEWVKAQTYPMTLLVFAGAVCTECGLTFTNNTMINGTLSVNAIDGTGITGRALMGYVAEIACGFVKATTTGDIEISQLSTNSTYEIAPSKSGGSLNRIAYFSGGLSYENFVTTQIARVQINVVNDDIGVDYPSSSTGETYSISNNLILASSPSTDLAAVAQDIYNYVHSIQYTPCKVNTIKTDAIRAGQLVQVVDINGTTFSTIIMKLTQSSSGNSYESTGSKTRSNQSGEDKFVSLVSNAVQIDKCVRFKNLETEGETEINGGNIITGEIKSQNYEWASGDDFPTNGTVLRLEDGLLATPYFKSSDTGTDVVGTLKSISVPIGDFKCEDYTEDDKTRVSGIIRGDIEPTDEDYEKYDINRDGVINNQDRIRINHLVAGHSGVEADDSWTRVVLTWQVRITAGEDKNIEVGKTQTVTTLAGATEETTWYNFYSSIEGIASMSYSLLDEAKHITPITNHVVESGTDGNWTYRKWSNGDAECWCHEAYTGVTSSASGSIHVCELGYVDFPSGLFVAVPDCTATLKGGWGGCMAFDGDTAATTSHTQGFAVYRPTSASNAGFTISISAKGIWKNS